jgi:primosomal protein N' (replication factor Y)
MELLRVVDVALDPRSGGTNAIYTYLPTSKVQVGDAVLVSLGNRQLLGYAIGFRDVTEETLGFDTVHLKPIAGIVAGLQIPAPIMAAVHYVSEQYLCPIPSALTAAVPPGVRDRLVKTWATTGKPRTQDLKTLEIEVLNILDQEGEIEEKESLQPGTEKALKSLVSQGFVEQTLKLKPFQTKKSAEALYRLTSDDAKVEKFLMSDGKKKPAQTVAVMQIQEADGSALSSAEIRAMAGVTETTVKALIKAEILEIVTSDDHHVSKQPPTPNKHQQVAIDAICQAIDANQPESFLRQNRGLPPRGGKGSGQWTPGVVFGPRNRPRHPGHCSAKRALRSPHRHPPQRAKPR